MAYYRPIAAASGGTGYMIYYVRSTQTIDIPVDYENICDNTMTVDGILQITGKAMVL